MKNKIIAANWKSNITKFEAKKWINDVSLEFQNSDIEIVIFPPFTLLDLLSGYIKVNSLPLSLGAQNISPFESGPYTGEVSGALIKEFADYVLIGHSERRTLFNENEEMINRKIEEALRFDLKPIVCISETDQVKNLNSDKIMLAYEPISSIGTNKPEDPQLVSQKINEIQTEKRVDVIYGGSVDGQNVKDYLAKENISGVLIGSSSIDPQNFIKILNNVY